MVEPVEITEMLPLVAVIAADTVAVLPALIVKLLALVMIVLPLPFVLNVPVVRRDKLYAPAVPTEPAVLTAAPRVMAPEVELLPI